MNVKAKLKLDEERVSHLIAWPRFIIGAIVVATIAFTLFTTSLVVGYGLKAMHYLQSRKRPNLVSHSLGVNNSR